MSDKNNTIIISVVGIFVFYIFNEWSVAVSLNCYFRAETLQCADEEVKVLFSRVILFMASDATIVRIILYIYHFVGFLLSIDFLYGLKILTGHVWYNLVMSVVYVLVRR